MVSTVRPRPNYYETLGITPTAASDEIAKAFAKATSVFRPHAFGAITEACMAYETLRNPTKRRAYDASIGLTPEPGPRFSPSAPREAPPTPRPVSPYPVERTAIGTAPPLAQLMNPAPRAEPAAIPLADELPPQPVDRDARSSSPVPAPGQASQPREKIDNEPRLAPQIGGDVSRHLSLEEQFAVEASPVDWKRIGKAAGAVAGAACFLGVLAGWWSAGDIVEPQKPHETASLPLPRSDQVATTELPQSAPPQGDTEARPYRPKRAAVAAARAAPLPAPPQFGAEEEQPQASQPGPGELEPGAGEQDTATETAVPTVAASMPLPNKVIARTIERIGYSCGAVTSSSPVEGDAPGVYKVTCASGQSYQAKPVNGRYRFRRWGRQ